MKALKTPGVYPQEISALAPSVVSLATAIPAFIGYTEKRPSNSVEAHRVSSLKEFHELFGGPFQEVFSAEVDYSAGSEDGIIPDSYALGALPVDLLNAEYYLYHSLRIFYANGGGACYITSVGEYPAQVRSVDLMEGLNALDKEDEPTLIIIPDAVSLIDPANNNDPVRLSDYYGLYQQALLKGSTLKDRFTIIDLHRGNQDSGLLNGVLKEFRDNIGNNNLNYGAAYYPWLLTGLQHAYDESEVVINLSVADGAAVPDRLVRLKYNTEDPDTLEPVVDQDDATLPEYYQERSLFHLNNELYSLVKKQIDGFRVSMPAGGAIAGVYARVDDQRGVFKAPANESLNGIIRPLVNIDNDQQEGMNVDSSGKSVNAIRSFSGKGVLIWGGRTLEGNSNEWRYISVRRFFLFAEESIKKAVESFVFEANSEATWIRLRSLIENFLTQQWKTGALVGATVDQAFYVRIGLGETMSAVDIFEGKLIVEIGMAAVRPAEFIILKFTHKLAEA